jgi:Golgi SNAP receptor complex protein 2
VLLSTSEAALVDLLPRCQARAELFNGSAGTSSSASHMSGGGGTTTRLRPNAPPSPVLESPFSGGAGSQYTGPTAREDFALREHTFLQETENSLDQYIAQGRAVLENLVEQKGMLRGTKRRLMGAAETLGFSRETIGWINRRRWVDGVREGALVTTFLTRRPDTADLTVRKTSGYSLAVQHSPSSCSG